MQADAVCVVGLGLIGGSLLRSLHRTGRPVFGWNRSAATVDAARSGGYDVGADLDATLDRAASADAVVVVATPTTAVDDVLTCVARRAPNCRLTDVVSVKHGVRQSVLRAGLGDRYVGGHPMAGTSQSGWPATDPRLFTGAAWVVIADDDADPDVWTAVSSIALSAGAHVIPMATDDHDPLVAAVSHLPHLMAAATAAVGGGPGALALRVAAGSFRDGTRVAGTAVDLQRAMIEANRPAVLAALSEAIDRLTAARDDLRDRGSVEILVEDGHRARLRLDSLAAYTPEMISGVAVGSPGWAAELRRQAHLGRVWVGG